MKEDEDSFEKLAMGTIGDGGICPMGPMGSGNMVGFMVLPRSWKIHGHGTIRGLIVQVA